MFRIGLAEIFLYLLPVSVGVLAGRRLKPLPNLCVMFLAMYAAIVANATWKTGKFEPLAVLGSMFSFPGIGTSTAGYCLGGCQIFPAALAIGRRRYR
jgi:hypothetical protein